MNSKQTLPNLNFARIITEKFFDDANPYLGEDAFYMFSVSKFILLKESIIKKDSIKNILYFDNKKFKNYIPIIQDFYKHITKTGSYKRNDTIIELTDDSIKSQELENAIWCFNKIRDSLAHGKYKFDFNQKCIMIENAAQDNSYFLKCEIPIDLLNSFTFFVEENIQNFDDRYLIEQYKHYIKKISKDFNIETKLYDNLYLYNYKYYNKFIDNNKYKTNTYIDNTRNNNSIYNNIYDNSSINNKNIIKDNNIYDKSNKLGKESKSDALFINKGIDFILNQEIEKISIEELCNLAKLLLIIKPKNQNEKELIVKLLKQFSILLRQYSDVKDNKGFSKKTEELITEMQSILGIKNDCKNPNGIISLYNYMSLVFSQTDKIDYSKLKVHPMLINFTPKNIIEGTAVNYFNTIDSIKRKCEEFNSKMESHISNYDNNQSQNYRHSLMDSFAKFYTEIMVSLGTKNKYVIDSLRNSIEHGNYKYHKNGYVVMYDQTDHNNDDTIKFIAAMKPKALFNLTKQVELSKSEEFLLKDFVQQLSSVIGNELFERTWNNLNKLSIIIFGKELNLEYTMENMYHEALATIISIGVNK